ncbi:hypothetical protein KC19_VG283800 [Ceratodon purpureus]|uniref:Uncharacterized protein n=1 Tax=Ceratodon purpureus TaxID=3225 RepID=A0A8T0HW42_CERPU|nr:hypothetical protein KC19_VG283800 [Ceratodon purpureus]
MQNRQSNSEKRLHSNVSGEICYNTNNYGEEKQCFKHGYKGGRVNINQHPREKKRKHRIPSIGQLAWLEILRGCLMYRFTGSWLMSGTDYGHRIGRKEGEEAKTKKIELQEMNVEIVAHGKKK